MKQMVHRGAWAVVLSVAVGACGSSSMSDDKSGVHDSDAAASPLASDAETPPVTQGADVEAWLAAGSYKSWRCEMMSHAQMKVSPHGKNLICSNDKVATFTGALGTERPVGSAAVKELYDDSGALRGYAVYVKTQATSSGGASWYWYERIGANVVADGLGDTGAAKSICVGCHVAAGSDDPHSLTGSSDFVYAQISN